MWGRKRSDSKNEHSHKWTKQQQQPKNEANERMNVQKKIHTAPVSLSRCVYISQAHKKNVHIKYIIKYFTP